MEIKRFFADRIEGNRVVIEGSEFLHMTKVLRHKEGYRIIANVQDGIDYHCTIDRIGADYATAVIEDRLSAVGEPEADVTLFQALPKGDKTDLILQKCVELGARKIVFFRSRYTNEEKFNVVRARKIIAEACKQCGRAVLPELCEPIDWQEACARMSDYDVVVLPYEDADCGRIGEVENLRSSRRIAVMVGSEGGFASEEIEQAKKCGAQIVSLGKRILRCETAAIVSLALVMYEKGELSR